MKAEELHAAQMKAARIQAVFLAELECKLWLREFEYKHLPVELQAVSRGFYDLANDLVLKAKGFDLQLVLALQSLCQAKDAAVRNRKNFL